MKKLVKMAVLSFALNSCANVPELETGEIKTWQLLSTAINQTNKQEVFIDSRNLLSRNQIDEAMIPILFVELKSGQNGTLTLYPGDGIGQTWLGADGATITLDKGILKASRGMGDDLMGATSSTPQWSKINNSSSVYNRTLYYLAGNNKILSVGMKCRIKKLNKQNIIEIWNVNFPVTEYQETCSSNKKNKSIKNTYFLDGSGIVRKSIQYHSETTGYVEIQRLDRQLKKQC